MNGTELPDPATQAVNRVVVELERHASLAGWDGPVRLFALVRTAGALERDGSLAERLPPDVLDAARADPEHLTAVEQENLPEAETLSDLLAGISWPDSVDGAAVVVERSVVPPEVEKDLPDDEAAAAAILADHPSRRDVRMAAAVLRSGPRSCAVRARDHDSDDKVVVGPTLVPALADIVAATLI
ncbi:PPA1309 family protein [Spongisporangium articulatum]|uniref:PPA1309 family protein n=1 Tax=Spongisporangium articulatum TaxID=3362603 RepID=A0ABW8APP4_9ACTN